MTPSRRPKIVGIVNVTADSFSDGGRYLAHDAAIAHARELWRAGADFVELGPASSHPDGADVSADEEIRRITPVVEALRAEGVALAVDSWQPTTQRWAIGQDVAILNDIDGFPASELHGELAASSCRLVVMHSVAGRGRAERIPTDAPDVLARIDAFFDERLAALEAAGVARERLVLDPGMGFFLGSGPEPSVAVLREIPRLKQRFGVEVLISVSRKSFLGALSGREASERGAATLAAELYAARRGADYLRTHDVAALRDALAVEWAIEGWSD